MAQVGNLTYLNELNHWRRAADVARGMDEILLRNGPVPQLQVTETHNAAFNMTTTFEVRAEGREEVATMALEQHRLREAGIMSQVRDWIGRQSERLQELILAEMQRAFAPTPVPDPGPLTAERLAETIRQNSRVPPAIRDALVEHCLVETQGIARDQLTEEMREAIAATAMDSTVWITTDPNARMGTVETPAGPAPYIAGTFPPEDEEEEEERWPRPYEDEEIDARDVPQIQRLIAMYQDRAMDRRQFLHRLASINELFAVRRMEPRERAEYLRWWLRSPPRPTRDRRGGAVLLAAGVLTGLITEQQFWQRFEQFQGIVRPEEAARQAEDLFSRWLPALDDRPRLNHVATGRPRRGQNRAEQIVAMYERGYINRGDAERYMAEMFGNFAPDPGPRWTPEAEARAEELLVRMLSPAQREQWAAHRCFEVTGRSTGHLYLLRPQRTVNVSNITRGVDMCVVFPDVPLCDQLLSQKILLEGDEHAFLKKANTFALGQGGPLLPHHRRPEPDYVMLNYRVARETAYGRRPAVPAGMVRIAMDDVRRVLLDDEENPQPE